MDQSGDFIRQASVGATGNWALLIDGENVASSHAAAILGKSPELHAVRCVYGDVAKLNGWAKIPELRVIHAPEGRNSADILLTIDAMTMAATGIRDFVIVTADGGLVHVVRRLREAGCRVVVMADDRATSALRLSGHSFVELGKLANAPKEAATKQSDDATIIGLAPMLYAFVDAALTEGVTVAAVNRFARKVFPGEPDAMRNIPQWLQWFGDRPKLLCVDPPGQGARIRTTGRTVITFHPTHPMIAFASPRPYLRA